MRRWIAERLYTLAHRLAHSLPLWLLKRLLITLIRERLLHLPPDEALRFLFELDAELYRRQGEQAIRYGGGDHTKQRHIRYRDFFVERIQANDHVLDLGCGAGTVAYAVASEIGAEVVAIDINAQKIEKARREYNHPNITYHTGDVLDYIPEKPFDAVILSNVLEHLPNRPDFLRRVQAVTDAPRFLIRVPLFTREWRVPLKKELGVEWRLDNDHEIEYTTEGFIQEMTAAGMHITHQQIQWGEIWAEVHVDGA